MKVSMVTGPGSAEVVDADTPTIGANDVLVRMRACGICGSDAFYITIGGIPPRQNHTPLGHEPAGEVVDVGPDVTDIAVGDHVVINPMAAPSGIIGNGGATGALAEFLLIENAVRGTSLEVIPDHIPFEVAALNEPMAVARHGANRCKPRPGDKVVVFGAGPIGLGAVLAFRSLGVSHVVVVDILAGRLEKAVQIGADAVINSAEEDVIARLIELHGEGEAMFPGKAGTDIYLDAAGAKASRRRRARGSQKGRDPRHRRRAQGTRPRRIGQRHEQRDHHRRIDGLSRRNLRSDQGSHRQLGEIRAHRQPHHPLRQCRRGAPTGIDTRSRRQGRGHLRLGRQLEPRIRLLPFWWS